MDPTTPKSNPSPDAIGQGYEPARLSARGLLLFVIGFFVTMAVIFWALHPVMRHFTREAHALDPQRSVVEQPDGLPPGAPALQPSVDHDTLPREDLRALHAEEDEVFARLGWLDDKGRVKVPDSVIERVAKRATTQAATRSAEQAGGGGK